MINVNMTSSEGVTLATKDKYCDDNIQVVPTFSSSSDLRQWKVTFPETIVGEYQSPTEVILLQETRDINNTYTSDIQWLVDNISNKNLTMCVIPSVTPLLYDNSRYFVLSLYTNARLTKFQAGTDVYGIGITMDRSGGIYDEALIANSTTVISDKGYTPGPGTLYYKKTIVDNQETFTLYMAINFMDRGNLLAGTYTVTAWLR